jgi:hypothetical protein
MRILLKIACHKKTTKILLFVLDLVIVLNGLKDICVSNSDLGGALPLRVSGALNASMRVQGDRLWRRKEL